MPNEHSHVGYLLTTISYGGAGLKEEMASINTDKTPTGMCKFFEAAVLHLLLYDPFQKKHHNFTSGKHDSADISDTMV